MKYRHIMQAVQEIPWAILPSKLAALLEFFEAKCEGRMFTAEEIAARVGAPDRKPAEVQMYGSVAVIPIQGVLSQKINLTQEISDPGGTSTELLSRQLRGAIANPDVTAIMLDINSPGGTVFGIPELGAEIARAGTVKKISALINPTAASAAYWLASQASEIAVVPSGQSGSIGVFMAHDDISAAMEMEGVKTTLISAGKFKIDGNMFEPLSDTAREHWQQQVNAIYGMFVNAVAKGRSVTPAAVRSEFGQGRMVLAKESVTLGMVDRIATYDETLQRLSGPAGKLPGLRAMPQTIRDYEATLRDAGWSNQDAKALASGGWKALEGPRDVEPEEDGVKPEASALLSWLRSERIKEEMKSWTNS